jgi:hypothetical protein
MTFDFVCKDVTDGNHRSAASKDKCNASLHKNEEKKKAVSTCRLIFNSLIEET